MRGERGPLAWIARGSRPTFGAFYTGLDVLAGIGAGLVTDVQQGGSPAVGRLFEIGEQLGRAGVWSLLVSAVATGALLITRHGLRAVPGSLLLAGSCFPFLTTTSSTRGACWPCSGSPPGVRCWPRPAARPNRSPPPQSAHRPREGDQ